MCCSRYWPRAAQAARDRTPPSVPTGLRVVSVTEDSVTLRWNASTDNSGRIQRYVVNGIYHDGASTTKTMTGLVPDYSVTYRVVAVDAAGNSSAPSAPLTATTARDTTAPTAVTGLRVTGVTPSSVSLAWNAASDRWSLSYLLSDGSTASGTSATVRGLAPGRRTPSASAPATPPGTWAPRATRSRSRSRPATT